MDDKKPSTEETKTKNEQTPPIGSVEKPIKKEDLPKEYGGTQGPEPTRYGDWENGGRCTDF